jgi:hypothetical protein
VPAAQVDQQRAPSRGLEGVLARDGVELAGGPPAAVGGVLAILGADAVLRRARGVAGRFPPAALPEPVRARNDGPTVINSRSARGADCG